MIGSMIEIHDPKDPRIRVFLNQKDAWLKASHNPENVDLGSKDDSGLFMAEGVLVVEQLIQSDFEVHSVLVTHSRAPNIINVLEQVPDQTPIYVVEQEIMDEIVGFPMHRGVLACGIRRENPDPIQLAKSCRALVVLEDLSNHDNVGSVFRSVAALGGAGVGIWMTRKCCDPLYRKALRVSMGHVLKVPFAMIENLNDGLDEIRELEYRSVAFTPDNNVIGLNESSKSFDHGEFRPALIFGAEGPGLTRGVIEQSDQCVRIEMTKDVDSLNIAVAAAVGIHRYIEPA